MAEPEAPGFDTLDYKDMYILTVAFGNDAAIIAAMGRNHGEASGLWQPPIFPGAAG